MKAHEQKLLSDAIATAMSNEIKAKKLELFIIIENIVLILLLGVLLWIGI